MWQFSDCNHIFIPIATIFLCVDFYQLLKKNNYQKKMEKINFQKIKIFDFSEKLKNEVFEILVGMTQIRQRSSEL